MKPEITNRLGERQWLYIVQRVGEASALAVIPRLGKRKPYPLNIARFLKIDLPAEEFLPHLEDEKIQIREKAKIEMAKIKSMMNQR